MSVLFRFFSIVLVLATMSENIFAQDFPNVNRYKAANSKLSQTPNLGNRIILMGDSITEFWSNADCNFFENKPYLINRGIGGQTTAQILGRFDFDVIALKPKVVVILAGTNDIAGNTGPISLPQIMENLAAMATKAQAENINVVLCSVLPVFDYPWKPGIIPSQKIIALNTLIKAYAEENGLVYLDYFSAMVDSSNGLNSAYSGDGVHPNKKGYRVMEPLLEMAILKSLKH